MCLLVLSGQTLSKPICSGIPPGPWTFSSVSVSFKWLNLGYLNNHSTPDIFKSHCISMLISAQWAKPWWLTLRLRVHLPQITTLTSPRPSSAPGLVASTGRATVICSGWSWVRIPLWSEIFSLSPCGPISLSRANAQKVSIAHFSNYTPLLINKTFKSRARCSLFIHLLYIWGTWPRLDAFVCRQWERNSEMGYWYILTQQLNLPHFKPTILYYMDV